MTTNTGDYNEIRRYLLGGLTEEGRQAIEQRMLTDEDFFEELLFAEEELADQYLNEGLSEEERRDFEGHFLSTPERRRKLRFARALNRYVSENSEAARAEAEGSAARPSIPALAAPPPARTWAERVSAFWVGRSRTLRLSAAFALVALIAGVVWLVSAPRPRPLATFNLSPVSVTRGDAGQATAVKVPPDADALKFVLSLPGGQAAAPSFRALLEDEDGVGERFEAERQDARTVSVVIPASRLARGRQYALKLFASGPGGAEQRVPGSYVFNVE
jgi:hypothetical protein